MLRKLHAPYREPNRASRIRRGGVLMIAAGLVLGGFLALGQWPQWIRGDQPSGRAESIANDLDSIRPQVDRFVVDRKGANALTPAAFELEGTGANGVFDSLRTGSLRPLPPAGALERAAPARYVLEVGDFTGARGPDHVVVLRGVKLEVCRAFNTLVGKPADPADVDPGDRYARGKGCIADPDTGDLVVFDVLYSS